jgi:hypothetical protein
VDKSEYSGALWGKNIGPNRLGGGARKCQGQGKGNSEKKDLATSGMDVLVAQLYLPICP